MNSLLVLLQYYPLQIFEEYRPKPSLLLRAEFPQNINFQCFVIECIPYKALLNCIFLNMERILIDRLAKLI